MTIRALVASFLSTHLKIKMPLLAFLLLFKYHIGECKTYLDYNKFLILTTIKKCDIVN